MTPPILATKLYKPRTKAKWVQRPHLIAKLNEGLGYKLSLISAPAGFGKTTLASTWLAKSKRPSAWLSLDDHDNNLTRFLTYLISTLQTIEPTLGQSTLSTLQSSQPLTETSLTLLINDISKISAPFILVLDDYHVINSKAIDEALSFLIEHQPPQMHLVLITREDPQLPLPRFRVEDELIELRVTDLRFNETEVSSFLNQAMNLQLSTEAITVLEARTEGWIAGLQMAALSMQRHSDTSKFIQAFTGSHHFVLDYLLEEVLQQQTTKIQTFLLQTSILERLQASLCDAVIQEANSQNILENLERNNLFVLPLDNERTWYRYHHLFADVLQVRLKNEPINVSKLHQRASQWYESNGFITDAIHHAFIDHDSTRVSTLIELHWVTLRKNRQEALVLKWLKALPEALFEIRPVLSTIYALILINRRNFEQAALHLQAAEVWLDSRADFNKMIVVDESQFRSLAATIANARAHSAQALGDISNTIFHAQNALKLLQDDNPYERATTAAFLGLAYWTSGDLAAAEQSLADGLKTFEKSGNYLMTIGGSFILAQVVMQQGYLYKAEKTHQQALEFITRQTESQLQGAAKLYLGFREFHYLGMSEIHYNWGNLQTANDLLHKGLNQAAQAKTTNLEYHWCIVKAQLEEAEGNTENALELLKNAELRHQRNSVPDVRPLAAQKARLYIKQGQLPLALDWATAQNLSSKDELSYLLEFEHITLARLLIAQFKQEQEQRYLDEAMSLLARLFKKAERSRTASAIEIRILQAVALEAKGDIPAALSILQKAITLAEPEAYIQIFVNEGKPIARLLKDLSKHTKPSPYIQQLHTALKPHKKHPSESPPILLESLSERELDVLKMLRSELSGPDIARHLGISLNTLRTHTKNIYSKLEVNNRRAALNRAKELELL